MTAEFTANEAAGVERTTTFVRIGVGVWKKLFEPWLYQQAHIQFELRSTELI